jgi:predicted metal-dependent phosphoesterase TrpH
MVQMLDIDDFLPEVLRYAPNVTDFTAQRFIIQAARDLCERCKVWRENDTISITAPEMQGVCTIADAAIVAIQSARLGDRQLEPVRVEWLDAEIPNWANDTNEMTALYVTQIRPDTIAVVPRETGTLSVRLALKPSRNATSLPALLLENYAEEIGRGAAGRILIDPNSENPQLGLAHQQWFSQQLETIATRVAKGQQKAPLRTRGRYL